jgi:S1-C subfamily serine protease
MEALNATVAALRFRDDEAVVLMDGRTRPLGDGVDGEIEIARDPAIGLAVVRVAGGAAPMLTMWSPRQPELPRFLVAADVRAAETSFRPVFIGALHASDSPLWGGRIWNVPGSTALAPGTFVFNLDGAFAGLTVERGDGVAIVPAEAVIAMAERLSREEPASPGLLGISVQALTSAVAVATGAPAGVVITWVDPKGPAASRLLVTDVVLSLGDQMVPSLEHWEARAAKVRPGQVVVLTVQRRDGMHRFEITAAPPATETPPALGLTLRTIRGTGAVVVRVDPQSAASRTGIEAGDVITLVGDTRAPTAADILRAYAIEPADARLLLGITRGATHYVAALERTQ